MSTTLTSVINNLTQAVTQETTVDQSAIVLISGIPALIAAAVQQAISQGVPPNQLQSLTDLATTISNNASSLAQALTANTSGAGNNTSGGTSSSGTSGGIGSAGSGGVVSGGSTNSGLTTGADTPGITSGGTTTGLGLPQAPITTSGGTAVAIPMTPVSGVMSGHIEGSAPTAMPAANTSGGHTSSAGTVDSGMTD